MPLLNTILVVDDSPVVAKTLSFLIQKAGYNVLSADDGSDALALFDGRDIDLVFTDLNMPNMNGIQLIEQVRKHHDYKYIPIVLFVADNENDRQELMKSSRATMLLDKSNIKEKLIPTIKKLIN
ncbi:MAG: response regulator [Ginsengibacter sp.]